LDLSRSLRPGVQKKSGHASEQDCADFLKRRQNWFHDQPELDPERLVFIDETRASANMARRHGRNDRQPRSANGRMAT
jgi:hypothetical protein